MNKSGENKEYYNVYSPLKKALPASHIHQEKSNPFSFYQPNVMHPHTKNCLFESAASDSGNSTFDLLTSYPTPFLLRNDSSFFSITLADGINKRENFYKIPSHRIRDDSMLLEESTKAIEKIKRSRTQLSLKDKTNSMMYSFSLLTKNVINLLAEMATIPLVSNTIIKLTAKSLNIPFAAKNTVILDLDETLVYTSTQVIKNAEVVEFCGRPLYIKARPNVNKFLDAIAPFYNIVVFTASTKQYADCILDQIDKNRHISYRIYRDHCLLSGGHIVKDLRLLGMDLNRVVLVDNCITCMAPQPDNGIPVISYNGNDDDNEMEKLESFLLEHKYETNIRNILVNVLNLRKLSLYCRILLKSF